MASAEFKYIPQTAATIFAFSSVQYKSFFYSTVLYSLSPTQGSTSLFLYPGSNAPAWILSAYEIKSTLLFFYHEDASVLLCLFKKQQSLLGIL